MLALAARAAADSSYTTAVIGLVGALIGGLIAGVVSLQVARKTREAAERAWIRDNRREIYDRFLSRAQRLLIACEAAHGAATERPEVGIDVAHAEFFEAYGVIQTVADKDLVDAARTYAYMLWDLKASLDHQSVIGPENFSTVAQLIRLARHDTIDAMRAELGLTGSARPGENYNPFVGTVLEQTYARGERPRPESVA